MNLLKTIFETEKPQLALLESLNYIIDFISKLIEYLECKNKDFLF